jgi:hypothetical protein
MGLDNDMISVLGTGLPNEGVNSCFMNSVLQIVVRLGHYTAFLDKHLLFHRLSAECMACQLAVQSRNLRSLHFMDVSFIIEHARNGGFGGIFSAELVQTHGQFLRHRYPQGDVGEFFVKAILELLHPWEKELVACDDSIAVSECFGFVARSRLFCSSCKVVSDSLEFASHLVLPAPLNSREVTLAQLFQEYFREETISGFACKCTDVPRVALKQTFLEKEPNILVIQIKRSSELGVKSITPIAFPEEFSSLRSGTYHIAGVIEHITQTRSAASGHYINTVWLGQQRYALYDDAQVVQEVDWERMRSMVVRSQVCMLFYIRMRTDAGIMKDGSENTPYERDVHSIDMSQHARNDVVADGALETPAGKCRVASQDSEKKKRKLCRKTSVESILESPVRTAASSQIASGSGFRCKQGTLSTGASSSASVIRQIEEVVTPVAERRRSLRIAARSMKGQFS